MKKMIFMLSFGYGGAESRILKISKNILRGDKGVLCINREFVDASSGRNDVSSALKSLEEQGAILYLPKVPHVIAKGFVWRYIWVLGMGCFYIVRFRPDIFHAVLGGALLTFWAKLCGAKTIVELTSPDNVAFVNRFRKLLLPFTNVFLAVSQSVASKAALMLGRHLDVRQYPVPYYESKLQVRPNKKVFNISFCSRFIPRKNGYLFAQSIYELLKRRDDFNVTIMGAGPEEEMIRALLSDYIRSDRVSLKRVSDPYDELLKSDVFVSLIQPDNYPSQSVLEAMDAGNALILSRTGNSDIFLANGNGLLTNLDPQSIIHSIEELLNDRMLCSAMGVASRNLVSHAFCPEIFLRYLDSIYHELSI